MIRRLAALALLVACPAAPESPDPLASQISVLRVQLRQLEIAARRYDEAIAEATESTCIGMHRTYDLQARMLVMNAAMVADDLDAAITEHGGEAYADVTCTVDAIENERSYHGAVACQELALADNQAEAGRHLVALGALTTHLDGRLTEIEAGQASEAATWTWSLPRRCP